MKDINFVTMLYMYLPCYDMSAKVQQYINPMDTWICQLEQQNAKNLQQWPSTLQVMMH